MLHIKDFSVLEPKAHPKHTLSSWIEDVYLVAYLLTPHLIRHMCRLTTYLLHVNHTLSKSTSYHVILLRRFRWRLD